MALRVPVNKMQHGIANVKNEKIKFPLVSCLLYWYFLII